MRKTIITLILVLSTIVPCFAVAGPSQWSLAGVASWAQPLTASGTALPATATYALGDFFALYDAAEASETFSIYRLCASGTDAVWLPTAGEGGGSAEFAILDATDLPSTTGNANKALALSADATSLVWRAAPVDDFTGYLVKFESIEGTGQASFDSGVYAGPFNLDGFYAQMQVAVTASDTVIDKPGYVMAASWTSELSTFYTLAPASSTQAVGVSLAAGSDGVTYMVIWGDTLVIVASDSESISPGDWLITSDTAPGHVMRASVSGDVPLSTEEKQRCIGYASWTDYYDSELAATYTYAFLKGNK